LCHWALIDPKQEKLCIDGVAPRFTNASRNDRLTEPKGFAKQ